ncbi:uncharacterized protein M421DRAFT_421440 [Didymella exigua CBS 183.55]|uniref:Protein kinase domain-containing protein n=1 Tax=Didymella exigua CBS 183.55 TaxID=1150837 RepID=A0A6A5RKV3_9PLEO|nr:uncharacterized protein M421DRAFT_421440 [Didymella exigua CBS 183.55]KAF1927604.1 hypothetical protein M421DRAFT_421440 [Didymella exigua CBS 183.55]
MGMGFFPLQSLVADPGQEPFPADNPTEYALEQRDARYAPEHQFMANNRPPTPIGEKTDVWKIAAVIWQLLSHGRDGDAPLREDLVVWRREMQRYEYHEVGVSEADWGL